MKTLIEHMGTLFVLMLILFVLTSVMTIETQIASARRLHTSIISQIQSSYYTADIEEMNWQLHQTYNQKCVYTYEDTADGHIAGQEYVDYCWRITVKEDTVLNIRKNQIVTLDYAVQIPMFDTVKQGKIEGYVR